LHWRAHRAICPSRLAGSSGEAEESIHKTHFSRRSGFEHEALPLAETSKPLIVADAVGSVLNPRVEFISRFLALPSVSYADADQAQKDR
jgi:hypothetical protein